MEAWLRMLLRRSHPVKIAKARHVRKSHQAGTSRLKAGPERPALTSSRSEERENGQGLQAPGMDPLVSGAAFEDSSLHRRVAASSI